jgi:hypothetical protein
MLMMIGRGGAVRGDIGDGPAQLPVVAEVRVAPVTVQTDGAHHPGVHRQVADRAGGPVNTDFDDASVRGVAGNYNRPSVTPYAAATSVATPAAGSQLSGSASIRTDWHWPASSPDARQ